MQQIRNILVAASAAIATSFLSANALAEKIDGANNLVCALTDIVACMDNHQCKQGNAGTFYLPALIVVDTKKKVIRGTHESGHKEVSAIKNMQIDGTHLILQGVENNRGWDIAIDTKSGKMRGAAVGDTLGFLITGTCTAL